MRHSILPSYIPTLGVFLSVFLLAPQFVQAQTATVQGTVTDAETGEPLPAANVLVVTPGTETMVSTGSGAATGLNGAYAITGLAPGTYDLLVQYVGYGNLRLEITLAAGQTLVQNLELSAGLDLGTITVESVGRRQEKVLDAPAAVSVLGTEEIETAPTSSPAAVLRNTTGVDMAQMGIDRYDIVLRGFNNAFSGATYTLTDYRQAAVPSLAVNAYGLMPVSNIDLERIEVVRGPASALYGPGVDAGVVHFFSKDAFTYPGTTIAVLGGERATAGLNVRHAGVLGEKFGYKFTGNYLQAEDWAFEGDDPAIDGFAVDRNDDVEKVGLNGSFEYRFSENTSLTANVGYNQATSTFYTGIGTVQGIGFSYTYGQLRLQSGRFFAQSYINVNDHGDSFVYGTGDEIYDQSYQINTQAQYTPIDGDRQNLIVGVDADWNTPRTAGTIYGRNEDDDQINEYGAYAQSLTRLGAKLDLTLAARLDYNNVQEEFFLSPRAALVFKPSTRHSVRATYNRAFSSPGNNSQFLDIVAGQIPKTPILIRGRGAAQGFTFPRNPAFEPLAGTDLVMTSLFPGPSTFNQPAPAGLPLDLLYAQIHNGLSDLAQNNPQVIVDLLAEQNIIIPLDLVPTLVAFLDPSLTVVEGFTQGQLGLLNPGTGEINPTPDVTDIDPLRRTTMQIVELGYKGVLNDRVLLAVDGYWARQENFVGPLLVETPFVLVPDLSGDLTGALATGIEEHPVDLFKTLLDNFGVTPDQVAALLVGFAADDLPDAETPIGIVQPNENTGAAAPELMLTYRNFGEITYYGVDLTTQVQLNPEFSAFGSLSWVSDDFFEGEEVGEDENSELSVPLNAPAFKFKVGGSYMQDGGFSANLAGRYVDGFPVRSGPYEGEVPSYFLLDLGLGYDFSDMVEGLRLDVLAQNLLDNTHREFVGVPQLGRYTTARLTFTF